jgi:regulator of nonsense transcripts 2
MQYVSEAVTAILEAPIKMKDIKSVVRVASMLYQRYEDFSGILQERLVHLLTSPSTLARTKRIYIRLFFAFIQTGTISSKISSSIFSVMRSLTEMKVAMDAETSNIVLPLVNAFLKAGRQNLFEPIYVYPNEVLVRDMAAKRDNPEAVLCEEKMCLCTNKYLELWRLSESEQGKIKDRMYKYFDYVTGSLENLWPSLLTTKKHNESIINTRGDLSDKKVDQYKVLCDQFEIFDKAMRSLATTMGKEPPDFIIPSEEYEEQSFARVVETNTQIADLVFDDPDDKALYTELPRISELVPSILLGKQHQEEIGEGSTSGELNEEESMDIDIDEELEDQTVNKLESDSNISLRELISKLPECVSIETCDSFAIEFCYANGSKSSSQKLLASALSRPPFGAIQLLPYYSRIIASLSPWFPIIKEHTLIHLQREFFGLKKKLDISTSTVEPRLRNATFIAELVKFGVYPPGKVFVQLRSLFDDFTRHNIDTACCLIQNCGRYLYKRPDTSERMVNMMNIMIKLNTAKNLDNRQSELILASQASMYAMDTTIQRKSRSPVEEYIRSLIYIELNQENVASVCSKLRRITWKKDSPYLAKKVMSAARKGRHDQQSVLALVLENLGRFYPSFPVDIIDQVMEEIMCGMEQPLTSTYMCKI